MEAGRELDALIAEKVMGVAQEDIHRRTMVRSDLPHYSTDIAAAWPILKKAADLDRHKTMTFIATLRSHVAIRKDMDYRITEYQVMIFMEPADICNAMLETTGVRTMPEWYYETGQA